MAVFNLLCHLHIGHQVILQFVHAGFHICEFRLPLLNVLNSKAVHLHVRHDILDVALTGCQYLVTHFIYLLVCILDFPRQWPHYIHNVHDFVVDCYLVVGNVVFNFLLSLFHLPHEAVNIAFNVFIVVFLSLEFNINFLLSDAKLVQAEVMFV